MNIDRVVFAFAGGAILTSAMLSWIHSPYWIFFTGFVGFNLFQAAFTGFCPVAFLLKRLGVQTGGAFH